MLMVMRAGASRAAVLALRNQGEGGLDAEVFEGEEHVGVEGAISSELRGLLEATGDVEDVMCNSASMRKTTVSSGDRALLRARDHSAALD
jgi:hypothetical protein